MRVKKKENLLIIDPFIPYNMNFQAILMPKVNLAKKIARYSKVSNKRTVFNNRTGGDIILQKV